MALLQEVSGGSAQPPRFVHVGEAVGAYRLASVEPDRATLAGPGGNVVVLLGIGGTATAAIEPRTAPPSQPAAPFVQRPPLSVAPAAPAAAPPALEGSSAQLRQLDRRELNQLKKELQQVERQKKSGSKARRPGRAGPESPAPPDN